MQTAAPYDVERMIPEQIASNHLRSSCSPTHAGADSAAASYTELRAQSSAVFARIGSFLADLCEGSHPYISTAETSVDTNLGSFHDTFSSLQARHVDENLTVAVLALTKSGELE